MHGFTGLALSLILGWAAVSLLAINYYDVVCELEAEKRARARQDRQLVEDRARYPPHVV